MIFKAKQRTAEKDHWIRSRSVIKDGFGLVKNTQKMRLKQIIWTGKLGKKWSFLGGQLLDNVTEVFFK